MSKMGHHHRVVCVVGAFAGDWIGRASGLYAEGEAAGFLMALLGAVVQLLIYHLVRGPLFARVGIACLRNHRPDSFRATQNLNPRLFASIARLWADWR